ncbi:hypothetical protein TNCV_1853571 [Trichonephila clavipes]|nr:hypothetical protein TNCV_1853571 [Trichonephila clavipes]
MNMISLSSCILSDIKNDNRKTYHNSRIDPMFNNTALQSNTNAIGDGPRKFGPWTSNEDQRFLKAWANWAQALASLSIQT